jgi:hypothetical protein
MLCLIQWNACGVFLLSHRARAARLFGVRFAREYLGKMQMGFLFLEISRGEAKPRGRAPLG